MDMPMIVIIVTVQQRDEIRDDKTSTSVQCIKNEKHLRTILDIILYCFLSIYYRVIRFDSFTFILQEFYKNKIFFFAMRDCKVFVKFTS